MDIVPVNCVKCSDCMPCPAGINIPGVFAVYNSILTEGRAQAEAAYDTLEVKADACIRCMRCEHSCSRHIGISAMMLDISEEFEG
ncbi:MAG: 4Fe-4S dicluster domain-containing protein [Lachnospiraceae bacterium]|nr:4Fe-4S dicluster domain-containing protein [Lachnospiraceae bacterium]